MDLDKINVAIAFCTEQVDGENDHYAGGMKGVREALCHAKVELLRHVGIIFSYVLLNWLGEEDLRKAILLNREEKDPNICHTHDFCDANMAMDEAMSKMGMEPEGNEARDDSWHLAKTNEFWLERR